MKIMSFLFVELFYYLSCNCNNVSLNNPTFLGLFKKFEIDHQVDTRFEILTSICVTFNDPYVNLKDSTLKCLGSQDDEFMYIRVNYKHSKDILNFSYLTKHIYNFILIFNKQKGNYLCSETNDYKITGTKFELEMLSIHAKYIPENNVNILISKSFITKIKSFLFFEAAIQEKIKNNEIILFIFHYKDLRESNIFGRIAATQKHIHYRTERMQIDSLTLYHDFYLPNKKGISEIYILYDEFLSRATENLTYYKQSYILNYINLSTIGRKIEIWKKLTQYSILETPDPSIIYKQGDKKEYFYSYKIAKSFIYVIFSYKDTENNYDIKREIKINLVGLGSHLQSLMITCTNNKIPEVTNYPLNIAQSSILDALENIDDTEIISMAVKFNIIRYNIEKFLKTIDHDIYVNDKMELPDTFMVHKWFKEIQFVTKGRKNCKLKKYSKKCFCKIIKNYKTEVLSSVLCHRDDYEQFMEIENITKYWGVDMFIGDTETNQYTMKFVFKNNEIIFINLTVIEMTKKRNTALIQNIISAKYIKKFIKGSIKAKLGEELLKNLSEKIVNLIYEHSFTFSDDEYTNDDIIITEKIQYALQSFFDKDKDISDQAKIFLTGLKEKIKKSAKKTNNNKHFTLLVRILSCSGHEIKYKTEVEDILYSIFDK